MPDQNNNNEFEEQKEEVEKVETSGVESTKEDYLQTSGKCSRKDDRTAESYLCVQRLHAEEF